MHNSDGHFRVVEYRCNFERMRRSSHCEVSALREGRKAVGAVVSHEEAGEQVALLGDPPPVGRAPDRYQLDCDHRLPRLVVTMAELLARRAIHAQPRFFQSMAIWPMGP